MSIDVQFGGLFYGEKRKDEFPEILLEMLGEPLTHT
jgi:hypothetical protein